VDEISELRQKMMTLMDWPPKCNIVDVFKINEPYKNILREDVCDCKNRIWYIAVSIALENGCIKHLLECITEPCMIDIVEYVPIMANHWQFNVNNSHCSYGRIHWRSKSVFPKLCAAKVLCFDKTLYFSS